MVRQARQARQRLRQALETRERRRIDEHRRPAKVGTSYEQLQSEAQEGWARARAGRSEIAEFLQDDRVQPVFFQAVAAGLAAGFSAGTAVWTVIWIAVALPAALRCWRTLLEAMR